MSWNVPKTCEFMGFEAVTPPIAEVTPPMAEVWDVRETCEFMVTVVMFLGATCLPKYMRCPQNV